MRALALVVLAACGHGFFDPQQPCDGRAPDVGSAGPAVVFRQSDFVTTGAGQNNYIQATLPLPAIADDVLVVTLGWNGNNGSTISNMTDSVSNAYTIIAGPTMANGGWSQEMFLARTVAVAAGSLLVEVSFTTSTQLRLAVAEYGNIDLAQPVDTSFAVTGSSSSTVEAGPVITTNAHDLLFVAGTSDYMLAGTLPGFTARAQNTDTIVEDQEVRATGTYHPMAAPGTNGNWVMQMVALRGL